MKQNKLSPVGTRYMCIQIYILFQVLFHYRLLQDIEHWTIRTYYIVQEAVLRSVISEVKTLLSRKCACTLKVDMYQDEFAKREEPDSCIPQWFLKVSNITCRTLHFMLHLHIYFISVEPKFFENRDSFGLHTSQNVCDFRRNEQVKHVRIKFYSKYFILSYVCETISISPH